MGPGIIRMLRPTAGGAHALRAAVFAVLAAVALLPHQASAQAADTASAKTAAVVLTPGSMVKTSDIDFGSIAVAGAAGTVVLSPQATATCTPSGTLIHSGACKAAAFSIRGKKNQRVRLTDLLPVTLTGPGGATMTMDTQTLALNGLDTNKKGKGWDWLISDPSGNASFLIGGTLHVSATQTPGAYTGTMLVEVEFN